MTLPRIERRAPAVNAPGPLSGRAAQVRLELTDRHQGLVEYDECGAIDCTAKLLAALHEELAGRVPTIAGDRTPRRRRKQLDGSNGLPLEDLLYIALSDADSGRVVLEQLAAALGYEPPVPLAGDARSPASELAEVVESFAATAAEFARAIEDGTLTGPEIERLTRHACLLANEVRHLRTALQEVPR